MHGRCFVMYDQLYLPSFLLYCCCGGKAAFDGALWYCSRSIELIVSVISIINLDSRNHCSRHIQPHAICQALELMVFKTLHDVDQDLSDDPTPNNELRTIDIIIKACFYGRLVLHCLWEAYKAFHSAKLPKPISLFYRLISCAQPKAWVKIFSLESKD